MKTWNSIISILILYLVLLHSTSSAQQAEHLSIQYHFSLWESDTTGEREIFSTPIDLFFTDSSYYLTRDKERKVVDFKKEKIYNLDLNTFTYDETSLYTEIDFRHTQFYNLIALKKFYSGNGIKNNLPSLPELESFWGIQLSSDTVKINAENSTDKVSLVSAEKDTIVKIQTLAISKNYQYILKKFLLYECHLHPAFLNSLLLQNKVPEQLSFVFYKNGKVLRAEYSLKNINEKASLKELNNDEFSYKYQFNDPLFSNINKVYGYLHNNLLKPSDKNSCLEEYQKACSKKNYADAFLILSECNLTRNNDYSPQIVELETKAAENKRLQILMEGVRSSAEKTETEKRIEDLLKLKKNKKLTRPYIIDAFLANHYQTLNDLEKAGQCYQNVISGNPYIAAVYYDLGNFLWKQNNYGFAWKCYDIAIRLNYKHPLCRKIITRKNFYRSVYPQYF